IWASKQVPLILPLDPKRDPEFKNVTDRFYTGWRDGSKPKPDIVQVYDILLDDNRMEAYDSYRDKVEAKGLFSFGSFPSKPGNEQWRWLGARRECQLGDDLSQGKLCDSPSCLLCSILRPSFRVSLYK
ncbi:hypothetical protein FRB99_002325, partial [Tulasnella sp. 403]